MFSELIAQNVIFKYSSEINKRFSCVTEARTDIATHMSDVTENVFVRHFTPR